MAHLCKYETAVKNIKDLPLNAKKYIHRIENYLGIPITSVRVGNRRDQMVE